MKPKRLAEKFLDPRAKMAVRDWDMLHGLLRDQGLSEYQIRIRVAEHSTVSGLGPRPMAASVVYERLGVVSNTKERGGLASDLAEACYECYSTEHLFRQLLDCDPTDYDRIQTVLVNLDIDFDHLGWHLRNLKKPLKDAIAALDSTLIPEKAGTSGRAAADLQPRKHRKRAEFKHMAQRLSEIAEREAGRTSREWKQLEELLRGEGWSEIRIKVLMAAARISGRSRPEEFRIGRTRPLTIPVVEERLRVISDKGERGELARNLAETCYECFSTEDLFRELLECDPGNNDRIMTALVELDLQLDHIGWRIRELRRPLKDVAKALDPFADKQVLADFLGRPVAGTNPRPGRKDHERFKEEAGDFLTYWTKKAGRSWSKCVSLLRNQGWSKTQIKDFADAAEKAGLRIRGYFKKGG